MTYTSVVMNPVSSDRKRKRMKRQQQMETVGNTDSVRGTGCSHGRPVPAAPLATLEESCLGAPAYIQ